MGHLKASTVPLTKSTRKKARLRCWLVCLAVTHRLSLTLCRLKRFHKTICIIKEAPHWGFFFIHTRYAIIFIIKNCMLCFISSIVSMYESACSSPQHHLKYGSTHEHQYEVAPSRQGAGTGAN